jgi:hypothetical protein
MYWSSTLTKADKDARVKTGPWFCTKQCQKIHIEKLKDKGKQKTTAI